MINRDVNQQFTGPRPMRGRHRMSSLRRSGTVRGIGLAVMTAAALAVGAGGNRAGDRSSRIPWTSSKVAGPPEPPPPYTVEPAFPRLKFHFPVVLVPARGTGRLFVGELPGRIVSFRNDPNCTKADLALDITKIHPDASALYGLIFHPKFDENHYVYVCYVLKNNQPDGSVVSRFEVSRTDPPVIDPKTEKVLLRFWSGGHNGGCLDFGTDGYLYISTGD